MVRQFEKGGGGKGRGGWVSWCEGGGWGRGRCTIRFAANFDILHIPCLLHRSAVTFTMLHHQKFWLVCTVCETLCFPGVTVLYQANLWPISS